MREWCARRVPSGAWPTKHRLLTTNYEPKSPSRRASDRSDEKIVNDPEPTGFRVAVGATVPGSIALAPMPSTTAEMMPQTRGLEVGRVEGQATLVDPKSKQIPSVIAQER
jgi:hypothetical protein